MWADVSGENKDNWAIPLVDIRFEGSSKSISKPSDGMLLMIPDSGTTFASIPQEHLINIV